MIYCKNTKTLTTEKLLDEMHLQWRLAGGKSKEDKDSSKEDEIALAAINTKGGRSPTAEASQRRRTLIRIRSATTAIKRGMLRPHAGKSTLGRNQSLQRIAKASKQAEVLSQQL
jgi:hypothetical protein